MAIEAYYPVHSELVQATSHTRLGYATLDEKGSPLKQGHIPQLARVVTIGDETLDPKLQQIGRYHQRSFEIRTGKNTGRILFADQYGNVFSSINLKGNNLLKPSVELQDDQPGGLLTLGLQDNLAIPRIIRASSLLRANHINTEIVLKVMKPQELPLDGVNLSIADFKKEVPERNPEEKGARKKLRGMNFVITARGMLGGERLTDLSAPTLPANPVIENTYESVKLLVLLQSGLETWQKGFDLKPHNKAHFEYYLTTWLPAEVIHNVAVMHKIGIRHGYLTDHNIGTSGAIYDLDSAKGKPLGDEASSDDDFIKDFKSATLTLQKLQGRLQAVDYNLWENCLQMYFGHKNWSISHPKHREKILYYVDEIFDTPYLKNHFIRDWLKLKAA